MTPEEFHAEWCVDEYRQEACRRGEDCEMMKQLRSTINLQIDALKEEVRAERKRGDDLLADKMEYWEQRDDAREQIKNLKVDLASTVAACDQARQQRQDALRLINAMRPVVEAATDLSVEALKNGKGIEGAMVVLLNKVKQYSEKRNNEVVPVCPCGDPGCLKFYDHRR